MKKNSRGGSNNRDRKQNNSNPNTGGRSKGKNKPGNKCSCAGTVCAHCEKTPEEFEAYLTEGIKKYGFVGVPVVDAKPYFAYSIGLTETYGCPEMIVVGDFDQLNHMVIGRMVKLYAAAILEHGKDSEYVKTFFDREEFIGSGDLAHKGHAEKVSFGCRPITEENKGFHMGQAIDRYGINGFKAVQIVLFDPNGKLPWHVGFDIEWAGRTDQSFLWEETNIDRVKKIVPECATCKVSISKLDTCGRCRSVKYCDKECQKKDWPAHKLMCK